jgi:hypothetical protein
MGEEVGGARGFEGDATPAPLSVEVAPDSYAISGQGCPNRMMEANIVEK